MGAEGRPGEEPSGLTRLESQRQQHRGREHEADSGCFVSSQVTLDVEFENGEVRTYTVEPLRAALLGHFGEHSSSIILGV